MTTRSLAHRSWTIARQLVGRERFEPGKCVAAWTEPRSPYESRGPSPQTAVDAVSALWASRLPDQVTAQAGDTALFADKRITEAIEALGGVDGARVLELGPLEGGHSYMLESAGATVVGVEANRAAFLKCLVTKELLQLKRCSFLCGDAIAYLEHRDEQFDVCIASGILYHMVEPVRLIELIAKHATRVFLSTHYYADRLAGSEFAREHLDPTPAQAEHAGYRHELYRFAYDSNKDAPGFCGGSQPFSNWLTREGLFGALEHFGWRDVKLVDDNDYLYGPAVSLTAVSAPQLP